MTAADTPMDCARRIASAMGADLFLYNGSIARDQDLKFIELVHKHRSKENVCLLLVTDGGSPDAAYKIARYLQEKYTRFTLIVGGMCKSAGTLLAVGAHEIAMAPYGELGPLDIQTYLTDNLAGMESGLTISEAIDSLSTQAARKHTEHYTRILNSTGRVVSFASAAKVATDLVTGLFGPIFARIDPYDVGQKARSMRIAREYGARLQRVSGNLKDEALDKLVRNYPSHSFVIDRAEVQELFKSVRSLSEDESRLIDLLGELARDDLGSVRGDPIMFCFTQGEQGGDHAGGHHPGGDAEDAGPNPGGAGSAVPDPAAEPERGGGDAASAPGHAAG